MPAVPLDRLLETCVKHDAQWIGIKRGEVPVIQLAEDQRYLEWPAVSAEEIKELVAKLLEFGGEPTEAGNRIDFTVKFSEELIPFSVIIIGTETVAEVWLMRQGSHRPQRDPDKGG